MKDSQKVSHSHHISKPIYYRAVHMNINTSLIWILSTAKMSPSQMSRQRSRCLKFTNCQPRLSYGRRRSIQCMNTKWDTTIRVSKSIYLAQLFACKNKVLFRVSPFMQQRFAHRRSKTQPKDGGCNFVPYIFMYCIEYKPATCLFVMCLPNRRAAAKTGSKSTVVRCLSERMLDRSSGLQRYFGHSRFFIEWFIPTDH